MIYRTLLALGAMIAVPGAARAQAPADYTNWCTSEGGLGVRFGAEPTRADEFEEVLAPGEFAPFTIREVVWVRSSRRILQIGVRARLASADEAERLGAAIRRQFATSAWTAYPSGSHVRFDPAGPQDRPGLVSITVGVNGPEVSFACVHHDLAREARAETGVR